MSSYAGCVDAGVYRWFFRARVRVRARMPEAEVANERGHDRGAGVGFPVAGLFDGDAVVPGEILK